MFENTLASPENLTAMLQQTEAELAEIQPEIEALEEQIKELRNLKLAKQRLLTLKMSLSTMLETFNEDKVSSYSGASDSLEAFAFDTKVMGYKELSASKTFHPDEAFKAVDKILKQRSSLNYEMFKAVVYNGGKASTEEIKAFLVESGAQQPQTGEGFENVPLTEVSSRANYLVRKGILQPLERGVFYATLGWVDAEN